MKFIKSFSLLSMGRLAIFAIVVTVGYYFMMFDDGSALTAQIEGIKGQVSVEQARRAGIEKTMKKEEEMRGNILQLARNLEVLKSKVPNDFTDTEMSTILNQASLNSDVKITVLSRIPAASQPKLAGSGAELIDEIVFDISATGTFAQLMRFVEILSKEEKIIKSRNFTIEKNSTVVDDNSIKFKGEIVGYKQSSIASAAPKAAGATK